jgi:peptide/nickel transport system permease protein
MNTLRRVFNDLKQYPSAIAGVLIISALIFLALYSVITIPYSQAIRMWRGGEDVWHEYPKNARPVWTNWFTGANLPPSIVLDSRRDQGVKTSEFRQGTEEVDIEFTFDFPYSAFPQEVVIYVYAKFETRNPHVAMYWETPDGREIRLGEVSARRTETYRIASDSRTMRRLGNVDPAIALFTVPDQSFFQVNPGTYKLRVNGLLFEETGDIDAKLVVHGQVSGMAGTDHRRRDITLALMWGTPIALTFGLLAAVGTTLTTMIIAAIGVWYSGVVDGAIQRITEVVLILPVLPILIMVGTFYSRSIWLMLGVVILLGIFGAAIKTYRAIFLQIKEAPYIEAAQAYGAGSWRIILRYLIPRIVPLLVPGLVVLIPSYVFLEASLAVLGLGDPVLPTWGKLIDDANSNGALFNGYYYWVLQPAALLMLTGLGFSMVGFALDRIFNPRLRGV